MKSLSMIDTKMNALVLHDVGQLEYQKVDIKKLNSSSVLVQIKASGICSSDIERIFLTGTYGFPIIPGHEFSGKIAAIGDNVSEDLLGKRTCVFPLLPCKKCKACKMEEYAQCSNYNYFGSRCDGGFAEYLVVPVWNLIPFNDDIDFDIAALCEPTAVSLHAVNGSKVKANDNVLVIGTGTIGFLIAMILKSKGGNVTVCGRSEQKLQFAKEHGFSVLSNDSNFENSDFDICFEAVGNSNSIQNAIKAVGDFGKVILVGNPKNDICLEKNTYWKILRKQISIAGTWNSSFNSHTNDWKQALQILQENKNFARNLITHHFKLEEYHKAFETLQDTKVFSVKVMFEM